MRYKFVTRDGAQSVTVFDEGMSYSATSSHINWPLIKDGLYNDDPDVLELFDPGQMITNRFARLSESGRVTVQDGEILFDGDPAQPGLSRVIMRFMEEGRDDYKPLVAFFENVMQNPNEHSRTQLFEWLNRHEFTITEDGMIYGYKSVYNDGFDADGTRKFKSCASGTATVNGVEFVGQIPQKVGDIVEMPRSSVQHDPRQGCHTGLHMGTWEYVRAFGGDIKLGVLVNPRDIVSVPTDCGWQKVRTCRYVVHDVVSAPHGAALFESIATPVVEDGTDDENEYYYGF